MAYSNMIKITCNDDFDFGVQSVQLIRDVSRDLEKRASAKSLLKYAKDPKQEDLHIIALGAYEGTGWNRNGDAFSEDDCKKNHHYFTKAGRAIHRHHKNKPTDPKFGTIKASAYNEPMKRIELIIGLDKDKCADILDEQEKTGNTNWSMASKQEYDVCFIKGTLIETYHGLIPIEEIEIGDSIKTHTGVWKKVTKTINNKFTGNTVSFDVGGVSDTITSTDTHPFYILKEEQIRNGGLHGRGSKQRIDLNKIKFEPSWVQAKDITEEDYLLYPVVVSNESLNLDNHAYALGLYLGDGSIIWSKDKQRQLGIQYTFDDKDPEIADKLLQLYPEAKRYNEPQKHAINIHIRNKELAELAYKYCGVYSEHKFIHNDLLEKATIATRIYFVTGCLDSDGSIDPKKGSGRIGGINQNVLYSLRTLLFSIGIPCGLQQSPVYDYITRRLTDKKYYSVAIGAHYCSNHLQTSVKVQKYGVDKDVQNKMFFYMGYALLPIHEIQQEAVQDIDTFNLSVEDDESYIVQGVIVHNCSWCGHKAKTDKDRCEHIPAKLGELNKEGVMCGMHNPNPKWFEMSHVKRPADRIGMSLGKMASAGVIRPPSDYINLYPDIYVPDDLTFSKKAADKRELLHKLAELEKHVEGIARGKSHTAKDLFIKRHAAKINHGDKVDSTSMKSLRKMDPSQVLKVLADNGIIFSPEDFSRYLFDNRVDKEHIDGMKTHLPNIYSTLDGENDGEVTNNEKFEPAGEGKVSPELKQIGSKLHEGHSLQAGPAVRRMMMITIMLNGGGLKPHKPEEQTKESFDKEFAKQYASYKLAALNYMNEQGKLDEDVMLNAVVQNRG